MKWFSFDKQSFKLLGFTVLQAKRQKDCVAYKRWGITFYRKYSRISELIHAFETADKAHQFNLKELDEQIAHYSSDGFAAPKHPIPAKPNRVAFLASILLDMGGHTECLKNMVEFLPPTISTRVFLTAYNKTLREAPIKIKTMQQRTSFAGVNEFTEEINGNYHKNLSVLFKQITDFAPETLFVFTHMDDVFASGILYLLKKYTKIKILYFNHATHRPAVGMSWTDLILEEIPATAYVTQHFRKLNNVYIYGLPCGNVDNLPAYRPESIEETKRALGIPSDCPVSITGCSSYKLFSANRSEYLQMIRRLLEKHKNLFHIIVTQFSKKEEKILNDIFDKSPAKERLKILPFRADFMSLFKCADFFIDSFPMSSALTHLNCMAIKIPSVVKINAEDTTLSFHEYFPPDYAYKFAKVSEMEKGVGLLLSDSGLRKQAAEKNYQYYLATFDSKVMLQKTMRLIKENPANFYEPEIPNNHYNFGINK